MAKERRFQVTRNGQYIGEPHPSRESAEQALTDAKADYYRTAWAGWISMDDYNLAVWEIRPVFVEV